jgi:hypothetical protein
MASRAVPVLVDEASIDIGDLVSSRASSLLVPCGWSSNGRGRIKLSCTTRSTTWADRSTDAADKRVLRES